MARPRKVLGAPFDRAGEPQGDQPFSAEEAADYIAAFAGELHRMALCHGLVVVAYLLDMARLEADTTGVRSEPTRPGGRLRIRASGANPDFATQGRLALHQRDAVGTVARDAALEIELEHDELDVPRGKAGASHEVVDRDRGRAE